MNSPVILLFQLDLRLNDHAALAAAVESDRPVLPVYVLDDETPGAWGPGGASRWWLHHSLASLASDIEQRGGRLVLRRGRLDTVVPALIDEVDAGAVYWSRGYAPHQVGMEQRLHEICTERGVEARRFRGTLLFEPDAIRTGGGEPFRVFTPFWKACLREPEPAQPLPVPDAIPFHDGTVESDSLDDWNLLPTSPDWSGGMVEAWTPGEEGATARLEAFLSGAVRGYGTARDLPATVGTSRLSPHLHHGELSPRQVWHAVRAHVAMAGGDADAEHFLRELGWREFSYHLLFHWPTFPDEPHRQDFARFPWRDDPAALRAWQQGSTGYPIVDAGMRELWHTGWMHNRVRMIVASFLVKHLLVPWQDGEAWFWDTLVDADLASNSASWQWVAGCGADAAPYFRIFNPILQGQKFDGDGDYVRRWVPELAEMPKKHIHAPWDAPEAVLTDAGVRLGVDYPEPIVDHKTARQRALDAFQTLKETA